jgi:hypothetical protein
MASLTKTRRESLLNVILLLKERRLLPMPTPSIAGRMATLIPQQVRVSKGDKSLHMVTLIGVTTTKLILLQRKHWVC